LSRTKAASRVPLNPDDPDNDCPEVAAWFDIDHLPGMPGLRPELAASAPWAALRTPLVTTSPMLTRAQVNYRTAGSLEERCGTCSMFLPEGRCSLVQGSIAAGAVCDRWQARDQGGLMAKTQKATQGKTTMSGTSMDEAKVMKYLSKHYPSGSLPWVSRCLWTADNVLLSRIDYQHRPGGRDPAKVAKMKGKLDDGWAPHAVVLVNPGGDVLYEVADGYHRLMSLHEAGIEATKAWVATPKPGNDGWRADVELMQREVLNAGPGENGDK
jgi:hypothetical protein